MLGDSFTFGWLLNKEDTAAYHLQRYADEEFGKEKFYFLNAGTGGWGTADYVAFVDDFIEEIKPDVVLVVLNTDESLHSINLQCRRVLSFKPLNILVINISYFRELFLSQSTLLT